MICVALIEKSSTFRTNGKLDSKLKVISPFSTGDIDVGII